MEVLLYKNKHAEALLGLYRDIFSEYPWNEHMVCTVCKKLFSRTATNIYCDVCGNSLEYFHKSQDVLYRARLGRTVLLSAQKEEMVGFVWGWAVTPLELRRELKKHGITISKTLVRGFVGEVPTFYIDELALRDGYRGGYVNLTKMLKLLLSGCNEPTVTFWTSKRSNLYRIVQNIAQFISPTEASELVVGKIPSKLLRRLLLLSDQNKRKILGGQ